MMPIFCSRRFHPQALAVLICCMMHGPAFAAARPNFIVMVADDLGYGDVGIFGNATLPTPNIDRMGREGAKLSHSLAAASLCTPSRAALLTGRYPVRSGMASPSKNRVFLFVAQTGGLPQSETTFAKVLKTNGYRTGLVGKWHLGNDGKSRGDQEHHPNRHGFDFFYGIPLTNLKDFGKDGESVVKSYFPHFHEFLLAFLAVGAGTALMLHQLCVPRFLVLLVLSMSVVVPVLLLSFQLSIPKINAILMRNGEVIEQPFEIEGSTARFVRESQGFMQSAMDADQPFLLVLTFVKVHTAHKPSPRFRGKSSYGPYGDCVMELDWGVGEILDFVSSKGQADKTMILFTSDNGGHLEDVSKSGQQMGGSNGIFRGGKGHGAMEGGIRVPTLALWPGVIPAGSEVRLPVSLMDFFPTVLEAAGLPALPGLDGHSVLPLLRNTSAESQHHKFLFHYCGSYLHGVTFTQDIEHVWKVYYFTPAYKNSHEDKCQYVCMCHGSGAVQHSPPKLFNLADDPSEQRNLASLHESVLQEVEQAVAVHRSSLPDVESQFDVWHAVWRPDLQPCCNFPLCACSEDK